MRFPFRLLFAHMRKSWLRALLTVLSVFVAVLMFGFLRTFIVGMETAVEATSTKRMVVMSATSLFQYLPKRLVDEVERFPGVSAVDPWTWYGGIYIDQSPEHIWSRFGVDPARFRKVSGDDIRLDDAVWEKWLSTPNGCIVGDDLAAEENFTVGKQITLQGRGWPGDLDLLIVGIYEPKDPSFDGKTLFMHWDAMNERSKENGGRAELVSTVLLDVEDGQNAAAVGAAIDASYESSNSRTRTLTYRAFNAQFNAMWGNIPLFFTIIGGVVLVACLMVTVNTMVLNARERVREFGILKSLGFTPVKIGFLMLAESLLLCLIGGALGVFVLTGLDGRYLVWVKAYVPTSTILVGLGVAAALGIVSGLIPAIIASRLKVIDAIRRRA